MKALKLGWLVTQVVRRILNEYLSGNGTREISRKLTIENIPTKTGNQRWERRSVSYILKNEKYIGDMLLQKKYNEDVLPYKQNINRGELQQYYVKGTYDDTLVRQIIHTIKVISADKIKIYFKNGTEYEQSMSLKIKIKN